MMRRVVLDTPYTGWSWHHLSYTQQCMRHCMEVGDAPMVAHFLYPPMFDGPGMDAGLAWETAAEAWVVYLDMGLTLNMRKSIERGHDLDRPVEVRALQNANKPAAVRLERALGGKAPAADPTTCSHEQDTPRFDTDRGKRRLLCWQCACGKVGPSIDEIKAVLREANQMPSR
jgi:hypothetical protein